MLGDFAYRTARHLEWLFEEDKDDDDDGSLCAAVESSSPPQKPRQKEARCVVRTTTTRSEKAFCLSPSSALMHFYDVNDDESVFGML